MKLSEYTKKYHGGQTELAKQLGVPTQLVWQWSSEVRPVPIKRCVAIEAATKGKVTRKDLRPHDWQEIWPELKRRYRKS